MEIHKPAQGSTEYLLILAAILAIAVVVVVVANGMLETPKSQAVFRTDSYRFAVAGMELVGYSQPFNGNKETAPAAVRQGNIMVPVSVVEDSRIETDISNVPTAYLGYLTYPSDTSKAYGMFLVNETGELQVFIGKDPVDMDALNAQPAASKIGVVPMCSTCCLLHCGAREVLT